MLSRKPYSLAAALLIARSLRQAPLVFQWNVDVLTCRGRLWWPRRLLRLSQRTGVLEPPFL